MTMTKRYTTGLIRPYTNWDGTGEPMPDQFSPVWKWIDEDGKERRLGKGWYKMDAWMELGLDVWLGWLAEGVVRPELGRDWLAESIAGPIEVPWSEEAAQRWAQQIEWEEMSWYTRQQLVAEGVLEKDVVVGMNESNCWAYGKKCHVYSVCWEGSTIENEVGRGRYIKRVPNHPVEVVQQKYERG